MRNLPAKIKVVRRTQEIKKQLAAAPICDAIYVIDGENIPVYFSTKKQEKSETYVQTN